MKINEELEITNKIKIRSTGIALILYPLFAGFAFASHPNLLSLAVNQPIAEKISEFHGNNLMHFGHLLMALGVPALIVISIHFMNLLKNEKPLLSLIGNALACFGAFILALDKSALCFVPSAFDTLLAVEYDGIIPGIYAMFNYRGYLGILKLLPLLPIGFIILGIGLVSTKVINKKTSIFILIGSLLMCNPDIDIIGLIATLFLGIGFIPYGLHLIIKGK